MSIAKGGAVKNQQVTQPTVSTVLGERTSFQPVAKKKLDVRVFVGHQYEPQPNLLLKSGTKPSFRRWLRSRCIRRSLKRFFFELETLRGFLNVYQQ